MYTTSLRKVGGSVMMAVPPALLEMLGLGVGAVVEIRLAGDRLIIQSQRHPHYTMAQLLAQCHASGAAHSAHAVQDEDRAWLDLGHAGHEL